MAAERLVDCQEVSDRPGVDAVAAASARSNSQHVGGLSRLLAVLCWTRTFTSLSGRSWPIRIDAGPRSPGRQTQRSPASMAHCAARHPTPERYERVHLNDHPAAGAYLRNDTLTGILSHSAGRHCVLKRPQALLPGLLDDPGQRTAFRDDGSHGREGHCTVVHRSGALGSVPRDRCRLDFRCRGAIRCPPLVGSSNVGNRGDLVVPGRSHPRGRFFGSLHLRIRLWPRSPDGVAGRLQRRGE